MFLIIIITFVLSIIFILRFFIFESSLSLILRIWFLMLRFFFWPVNFSSVGVSQSSLLLIEWDSIRVIFITLSVFITLIILLNSLDSAPNYKNLQNFLLLVLILAFTVKHILGFYISFEIRLLPITLIILGFGYQPERIFAGTYIIVYTVAGSMPLLFIVLLWLDLSSVSYFYRLYWTRGLLLSCTSSLLLELSILALVLGFLVKFPMYGLHLWLPKAHVEASVEGSIILAGLLLKLGGFGLIYFLPGVNNRVITSFLLAFRLFGGCLIRVLCLRLTDIKILIAYSSVAHIAVCIASILSQSKILILSSLLIIVAHGVTRPAIFLGAYYIYKWTRSRNMLLNTSVLNTNPLFTLWWFLFCIANISAPPTFNLIGELLSIIGLVNLSIFSRLQLGLLVFFSGAYTLVLYASTQHGQLKFTRSKYIVILAKDHQIFLSLTFPIFGLVLILAQILI